MTKWTSTPATTKPIHFRLNLADEKFQGPSYFLSPSISKSLRDGPNPSLQVSETLFFEETSSVLALLSPPLYDFYLHLCILAGWLWSNYLQGFSCLLFILDLDLMTSKILSRFKKWTSSVYYSLINHDPDILFYSMYYQYLISFHFNIPIVRKGCQYIRNFWSNISQIQNIKL